MREWINSIADKTITDNIGEIEFTRKSGKEIQRLIRRADFNEQDSNLIFRYLYKQVESISFGTYLKRYVYLKAGIKGPFNKIEDSIYKDIIVDSFNETYTPKSFHETSVKLGTLVSSWLSASTVSRETVFLLGFGLRMSTEDVSEFLTKAIHEQTFDFNIPEECIFWYCLKYHLYVGKALAMIRDYQNGKLNLLDYSPSPEMGIIAMQGKEVTRECLLNHLYYLKREKPSALAQQAALRQYKILMKNAKKAVEAIYHEDFLMDDGNEKPIREIDVEKVIYNGIPVDKKGNLFKASLSKLQKSFVKYRLTRQRMSGIESGRIRVSRYDLITLFFFITAQQCADEPRIIRYKQFLTGMDRILKAGFMGPLNVSNPYEAFILLCLLTDWPMAAFSEVWELSYDVVP